MERSSAPHHFRSTRGRMVWVINIAVFLATTVAALLVFLMVSQKEQIKKAFREKRKEERTKLELELELATLREPPSYGTYSTENTSRHGARIVSGKHWQLHEHVLVRLPFKNESKPARITYCDTLPANAFAVGLQFPLAIDEWLVPDNDV